MNTEPNMVIMNSNNQYQFPNPGQGTHVSQRSNAALQASLNSLGIPGLPGILSGLSDTTGDSLANCRQYQGLSGLQTLQNDMTDPNATTRCGWRYKSGTGPVPEVAQGAYGNRTAALDPARPAKDAVGNGVNYIWNLKDAEKTMVKDICKAATSCMDMATVPGSALGDFGNVCGYCTTSAKVIPVIKQGNTLVARYTDVDLQCDTSKLISAADATSKCPPPQPGAIQPAYMKCFTNPLDRDCVTLSATYAGCSPQGTLISALSEGNNQKDYADQLRQKKSFQVYQSLANPVLNNDMLTSGNATLFASFMNAYNVNRSMYVQDNEKLRVAATDLCRQTGLYESYSFCSELTDGSRDYGVDCMQEEFYKNGGTPKGTAFPKSKDAAGGASWGDYKKYIQMIIEATNSSDPNTQREAMNKLTGLGLQEIPNILPRTADNQGVEVFWFDRQQGGICMGRRPTLSSSGSNIPNFNTGGIVEDTGLHDWVEFLSICNLRPTTPLNIILGVVTDDGVAFAFNQDIFAPRDRSKLFSWYYDQGPTWHNTSCVPLFTEGQNKPNILSITWFETGGGATFIPYWLNCAGGGWKQMAVGGNVDAQWKDMCYFTQDLNAPSLSFGVYERNGTVDFIEKRMATKFLKATSAPKKTFESVIDNNLPPVKSMTLNGSTWKTATGIAFSAFHTVTLCFKINAVNGTSVAETTLFSWKQNVGYVILAQDGGNGTSVISLDITTQNGQRAQSQKFPIKNSQWYVATLVQMTPSTFARQITGLQFTVQSVAAMRSGDVTPPQGVYSFSPGGLIMDEYKNNRGTYGRVTLCGSVSATAALNMSVAWVHFYDKTLSISDAATSEFKIWNGVWYD